MAKKATNLTMDQGSTFGLTVLWQDDDGNAKDLTGYSGRMQIRPSYTSNTIIESLSTSNGEITIEASNGSIQLTLPATRTSAINATAVVTSKPNKSVYIYDLEMEDADGNVLKLLWGDMTVFAEVTK